MDHLLTGTADVDHDPPLGELVETPIDVHDLCLNPGSEVAPRNPLCPVCEAEIRPVSNDAERRFVCDCEQLWQFRFEPAEGDSDG